MKASLKDWHYARPQLAEHHLQAFDFGLISAIALYARRRMGKTEYLLKDLLPAAQKHQYAVGYCNLWQEDASPIEALIPAIKALGAPQSFGGRIKKTLSRSMDSMKVSAKAPLLGEASAEIALHPVKKDNKEVLLAALEQFDSSKNIGLLLIDEAQILANKQHESLERALRAMLDTRKDRLKVIFTGSSEDRLRTMFGSERKPFYNWAKVDPMPLLGKEFVEELTRRANELTKFELDITDTLRAFAELRNVPELFRRFLAQYLSHPFEGVDKAIEACKQSVYEEEGFQKRWLKMLPADRILLTMVANNRENLHSQPALQEIAQGLGLNSVDRTIPQNALKRLRQQQILIQEEYGRYRFEDEAFKEWVLAYSHLERAFL